MANLHMGSCHENAPKRGRIELGSRNVSSPLSDDQLGQAHDVFLSFRGADTRTGFTDHLHDSLCRAGVRVFRDNEKLHFGEEIGPQLIRAIKESKISIPVFSKNYAASKWCLREITLMMECRKTTSQIVLPIFYDVTPNEVQHQTGKFKKAFTKHVKMFSADTVQEWKNALSEVGSLKGLEKEKMFDGYESKLVNEVIVEVQKILEEARIMNIPDGLEKLKETLLDLNVVLDDAEVKALDGNRKVKRWLNDFRDISDDIDDLWDEERIRRSLSAPTTEAGTSQNSFIPSGVPTPSAPQAAAIDVNEMKRKMIAIEKRINEIVERKKDLGLRESSEWGNPSIGTNQRPPSTSLMDPCVFGRESDKQKMLKLLKMDECDEYYPYSVIPIVGMAGVGKTTLAQLIFNDPTVTSSFDARAWACVSHPFNAVQITRVVLQSISENADVSDEVLDFLQRKLSNAVSKKKVLIVLDDVWTENFTHWTDFLKPFQSSSRGSKIIVTTRHQRVVTTVETVPGRALSLGGLSSGDCWSLFAHCSLGSKNFDRHPRLKLIGDKIVDKCGGLPLAVKTLGGLLRSNYTESYWESILKSKIWDLERDKNDILPALKLSYIHLPYHLKRCFAYCALFPQDYEFDKDEMVEVWMAQGLSENREEGLMNFDKLLGRSFFQQSGREPSLFVMHDLMNELAILVAGETFLCLTDIKLVCGKGTTCLQKVRHLSIMLGRSSKITSEWFQEFKCLRTFWILGRWTFWSQWEFNDKVLHKQKDLRVLSFGGRRAFEIQDGLKHLRYLNLGGLNEVLPESICTLYNLETLILRGCERLTKLPKGTSKLMNLKHLDIRGAYNLWKGIPLELGAIPSLKILVNRIDFEDGGQRFKELKNVLHVTRDDHLTISCVNEMREAAVLRDAVQSIALTTNIVRLSLVKCPRIEALPPLGLLSSLEELKIEDMHSVNRVGPEFYGNTEKPFPSLQVLNFEGMTAWQEWDFPPDGSKGACGPFPHLRELNIWKCPKLMGKLPSQSSSLEVLRINNCPMLGTSTPPFTADLPSLRELEVAGCDVALLTCLANLTSLSRIYMENVSQLSFSDGRILRSSGAIKSLSINSCNDLTCFWKNETEAAGNLSHLSCGNLEDSIPSSMQELIRGCQQLNSSTTSSVAVSDHEAIEIPGAGFFLNVEYLRIESCPNLNQPMSEWGLYGSF